MKRYEERLIAPWWIWLGGLALAASLAAGLHLGASGWRAWLPYVVVVGGVAGGLGWLSRLRVWVTDTAWHVDDATLPRQWIADVEVLDRPSRRHALAAGAHPLGFVVQRPWISGAVRVTLCDPDDPTPYWVVSSRRPAQLARALRSGPDPAARLDRASESRAG